MDDSHYIASASFGKELLKEPWKINDKCLRGTKVKEG
jgi:hypothetical protein